MNIPVQMHQYRITLQPNPNEKHKYGNEINELNPNEIDNILDEIEENEAKVQIKQQQNNENVNININVNWNEILKQIGNGNINYIKNLITANDININTQNPLNGKTLLIYSGAFLILFPYKPTNLKILIQ